MTGWSEGALFSNSRHSSKRKERRSDVYSWLKFSAALGNPNGRRISIQLFF